MNEDVMLSLRKIILALPLAKPNALEAARVLIRSDAFLQGWNLLDSA
jgi:hypothetical protein